MLIHSTVFLPQARGKSTLHAHTTNVALQVEKERDEDDVQLRARNAARCSCLDSLTHAVLQESMEHR